MPVFVKKMREKKKRKLEGFLTALLQHVICFTLLRSISRQATPLRMKAVSQSAANQLVLEKN